MQKRSNLLYFYPASSKKVPLTPVEEVFGFKARKRLEIFYLNQGKSSFFVSFGKSLIIACTISL